MTATRPIPPRPSLMVAAVLLPAIVGVLAGGGAAAVRYCIESALRFGPSLVPRLSESFVALPALLTALGALVAAVGVGALGRGETLHGTSAVIAAVAYHRGRVDPRPMLTRALAAVVVIGAGGSTGPEGPSIEIGAVVGSALGKRFGERQAMTYIVASAAAAIAALFGAPMAGIFFAIEVVGAFTTTFLTPVMVAAVTGALVNRAVFGETPFLPSGSVALVTPLLEVPLFALLGVVAALFGIAYVRGIELSERAFAALPVAYPVRALLGGAIVGGIGLYVPLALGLGDPAAAAILRGLGPSGVALALLLAAKFTTTAVTLGAVRVGGNFAPAVMMGAMLGSLFGGVAASFFPGSTAAPAAYGLVGMGAVLAAAIRAPLTAVILPFEMTGDFGLTLPSLISVLATLLVARRLYPESIYTAALADFGLQIRHGLRLDVLALDPLDTLEADPDKPCGDSSISGRSTHLDRTVCPK